MRPVIAFVSIAGTLCVGLGAQTAVRLSDGPWNARCVLQSSGRALETVRNTVLVDCTTPAGIVACDFDRAEPIDVPLDRICRSPNLSPQQARVVAVQATPASAVTIDWLEWSLQPEPRIVATRRLIIGESTAIPVVDNDARLVRFSRAGAAPHTVAAAELLQQSTWTLPAARAGGELLVRSTPALVAPETYQLSGPWLVEKRLENSLLRFEGVPPGRYQLTPVYAGGLTGIRRAVSITNERSTSISIPAAPVGAVQVEGDTDACFQASTLVISRASVGNGVSAIQQVYRAPVDGDCVRTVAGLRAGSYEAAYRSQRGLIAAGRFEVAPQTIASVRLMNPRVTVTGTVRSAGQVKGNVEVTFVQRDNPLGPQFSARTDATGTYVVQLPEPGAFQVSLRQRGFESLGSGREFTAREGDNRFDVSIDGAGLRIALSGWDRSSPVLVTVTQTDVHAPGLVGDGLRIEPDDALPKEVGGLPFGEYVVQAQQRAASRQSPAKAGGVTVRLDQAHPNPDVVITLRDAGGMLSVVDRSGNPIEGATLLLNGSFVAPVSPGLFPLKDAAPGTFIVASAPGFTPSCQMISDRPDPTLALVPGLLMQVEFTTTATAALTSPPGFLVWPGTACPIVLADFEFERLVGPGSSFVIRNFPAGNGVAFRSGPFDRPDQYQLVVPGPDGIAHLRLQD